MSFFVGSELPVRVPVRRFLKTKCTSFVRHLPRSRAPDRRHLGVVSFTCGMCSPMFTCLFLFLLGPVDWRVLQLGLVKQKRSDGTLAQLVGQRRGQHLGEARECIVAVDFSRSFSQCDQQLEMEIHDQT